MIRRIIFWVLAAVFGYLTYVVSEPAFLKGLFGALFGMLVLSELALSNRYNEWTQDLPAESMGMWAKVLLGVSLINLTAFAYGLMLILSKEVNYIFWFGTIFAAGSAFLVLIMATWMRLTSSFLESHFFETLRERTNHSEVEPFPHKN